MFRNFDFLKPQIVELKTQHTGAYAPIEVKKFVSKNKNGEVFPYQILVIDKNFKKNSKRR